MPLARWHWLVVAAIVGAIAGVLTDPVSGLSLTASQVGLAVGIYIAGAWRHSAGPAPAEDYREGGSAS